MLTATWFVLGSVLSLFGFFSSEVYSHRGDVARTIVAVVIMLIGVWCLLYVSFSRAVVYLGN
jgi:hypothetical protein